MGIVLLLEFKVINEKKLHIKNSNPIQDGWVGAKSPPITFSLKLL